MGNSLSFTTGAGVADGDGQGVADGVGVAAGLRPKLLHEVSSKLKPSTAIPVNIVIKCKERFK